jgi:16S rRNA (adenine1518-N6/adenine1519-N6)-dimethyltransferase
MPGQTLTEIRRLLTEAGLAPQHRFGQNFLIDLNLMRKLAAAADLCPADTVLEVGPGTGSLTEILLDCGVRVVAVEIDRGFQAILRTRLAGHPHFTLVQGDALGGKHNVNPLVLKALYAQPPRLGGAYKLVANLPYQIATPLLMDLLLIEPGFARLTCTIQREVGERLAAAPRTGSYGPVSVVTQTLADLTPLAIVRRTAFWPRPDVESIMLTLAPRPPERVEVSDVRGFAAFVQRGFQQRRKMLRRLLRGWEEAAALLAFQRAGVSSDARPEELSPAAWRALYEAVTRLRSR